MKFPLSHRTTGALDWFCLGAIAFYQRELSPRKGYRCAHARLHGGAGCSDFARDAIAQHGLNAAIPLFRTRFANCKLAARTLRAQHAGAADESKQRRRNKSQVSGGDWCNFADCTPLECCDVRLWRCADSLIDCGPGDTGCCDVGDCNCLPCD